MSPARNVGGEIIEVLIGGLCMGNGRDAQVLGKTATLSAAVSEPQQNSPVRSRRSWMSFPIMRNHSVGNAINQTSLRVRD